jgi:uncharacterized membrane protein/heat shock protein HslJ
MFKYAAVFIFAIIVSGCSSQKDITKSEKPEIQNYGKKQALGIDFFASGNEPFWSLDMDSEDSTRIFFLNPNSGVKEFVTPLPFIDTVNKIIVYRFSEGFTLTVNRGVCINGMSGERNEFSAILNVDGKDYNGCGRYIIASKNPFLSPETLRLNDIWALRIINGKEINRKNFKEGIPMLELHLNDGRFYGKADCNEIYGIINVGDSYINFTDFSSTKKSCEGDFENDYIKTLKNVDTWELNKMNLILKSRSKAVLTYIKID